MKKIIFFYLLFLSLSSYGVIPKYSIEEYCHMGDSIGIKTKAWRNFVEIGEPPDEYMCASYYKDVSPDEYTVAPNTVSVYGLGNAKEVFSIKLILNIQNPKYTKQSIFEFKKVVKHYIYKVKKAEIDTKIIDSRIDQIKNGDFQIGDLNVVVQHIPWPDHVRRGFAIHVVLK